MRKSSSHRGNFPGLAEPEMKNLNFAASPENEISNNTVAEFMCRQELPLQLF